MGRRKSDRQSRLQDLRRKKLLTHLDEDFDPQQCSDSESDERISSPEEVSDLATQSQENMTRPKKKHSKKNVGEKEKPKLGGRKSLGTEANSAFDADANARMAQANISGSNKDYRKPAFETRCSPRRLQTICQRLTNDQANAVKDMGFGSMLDVQCNSLNRVLCLKLVNALDLSRLCMCVRGSEIPINYHDVHLVFDLPDSGLPIPSNLTKDENSVLKDFDGITDGELENIIGQGRADDLFRRAFVLYALSTFLCPTSKLKPSPKLPGSVLHVNEMHNFNWSQLIFDWLVSQISLYRKSKTTKKNIGGCIFLLMGVLYPIEDSPNLSWIHNVVKHEVTRYILKKVVEFVKPLDDELLGGHYNLDPVKPKASRFDLDYCNDEEHNQQDNVAEEREDMLEQLYNYCTSSLKGKTYVNSEMLVSINKYYLDRNDTESLAPKKWIMNTVVSFASMIFNEVDKMHTRRSRHCLPSWFLENVTFDLKQFKNGRHKPWERITTLFDSSALEALKDKCNLIFAPVVHNHHWWCYALERQSNTLYVLDSMGSAHSGDKAVLDDLVAIRFEELLVLFDPTLTQEQVKLQVKHVELPEQDGRYDCGVYTIKYMEMWDGVKTYEGGNTMPSWTKDEVANLRRDLLIGWIMDARNEHRAQVLQAAEVGALLSTASPSIVLNPPYQGDASRVETTVVGTDNETPEIVEVNVKAEVEDVHGKKVGNKGPRADVMEKPASTIAERVKTHGRKQTAGLHGRSPCSSSKLRPREK